MRLEVTKIDPGNKVLDAKKLTHYAEFTWRDWAEISPIMTTAYGRPGTIPWGFQIRISQPKWYYSNKMIYDVEMEAIILYFKSEEQITYLTLAILDL